MICGIPVSSLHFPVSVLLAIISACFISTPRKAGISAGIALVIIFISLWLATLTYDCSFDSYCYHFDIAEQLRFNQWNPYLQLNTPENSTMETLHYPKYSEWVEACLYSTFDNIQLSTGYLLLLATAVGLIEFSVISVIFPSIRLWPKLILILTTILNPLWISQNSTACNDSLIYFFICLTVLFTINIWKGNNRLIYYAGLAIVIILAVNTKNNALVLEMLTGIAIIVGWYFFKPTPELKRYAIIGFSAGCLAFLVWGFHPYITNWVNHGTPIYPQGTEAYQELCDYSDLVSIYQGHNRFENFFISIFTPGLINPQATVCGYGIGFASLLILTTIVILIKMIFVDKGLSVYSYAFWFIIASCFIFVSSWNARFIPQLWLIVPCTVISLFQNQNSKIVSGAQILIAGIVIINAFVIFKFMFLTGFYERVDQNSIYKTYSGETVKIWCPSRIIVNELEKHNIEIEKTLHDVDHHLRVGIPAGCDRPITYIIGDSAHIARIQSYRDSIRFKISDTARLQYLLSTQSPPDK